MGGVALLTLILFVMISACSDSALITDTKPEIEISKIDGQPIKALSGREFYKTDWFEQKAVHLAGFYGHAIIQALNEKVAFARNSGSAGVQTVNRSILVKDLNQYIQQDNTAPSPKSIGSTQIRLTQADGETEDFVLTLRPYIDNISQFKASADVAYNTESTYLALSPDRFYLDDDENGNELWPITFPAINLADSTDVISVTFNKEGYVSSSLESGTSNSDVSADIHNQPNIVFMEATPIVPLYPPPCEPDCGGGGGGGGSGFFCNEVGGNGEPTGGNFSNTDHFFSISLIRIVDTGDGDGAAEVQFFLKNDDTYDNECFPRSYRYEFDEDGLIPSIGFGSMYYVPDVNYEDVSYDEFLKAIFDQQGYIIGQEPAPYPLINLTQNPGPWRLVLIDDDKDFEDYSRRRNSDPYVTDVWTYDMADGNWKLTETGFSADSHHYGTSDDPLTRSGVRRITLANALNRSNTNGDIIAAKLYYGEGTFKYIFSI